MKKNFTDNLLTDTEKTEDIMKRTCYCGVCEYLLPIKIEENFICLISATGFLGNINQSICEILSKRTNLSLSDFYNLRQKSLREINDEKAILSSLEILAWLLKKYISEETDIPYTLMQNKFNRNLYIMNALSYIEENFSQKITANDVAKNCHVSLSHLQHLFSKILGHGIAEEIRYFRLKYAEELLCTTNHSVRYIAISSGFPSADYFSTIFKKHFKLSPLKYRQINKHTSIIS